MGRSTHLDALDAYLNRTGVQGGHVLLLRGEAGIGKTRLVAEARVHAVERGMQVLQGNCFEMDRLLPYAPFLELVSQVPELSMWPAGQAGHAGSTDDAESVKRRTFDALVSPLVRLAEPQPVLIVIEDVHWIDSISAELVAYLARRIAARPMLLLLTYRPDDAHAAMRGLLSALDRERLASELTLQPLAIEDIERMLQAIFDLTRAVPTDFLQLIARLTEGNPFFIEEILRSLIDSGEIFFEDGRWGRKPLPELHVPRSVREAVQQRTSHLSVPSAEALQLAAVAGRRFGFGLLAELSGQDEAMLVASLKELLMAGLVVEESADQFAFRHALTREAVYGGLLARERRALHRRVAELVQRLHTDQPAALDDHLDLAYHFHEAEAWEQVLECGLRAGVRALALFAPQAAVDQLTRALDAADHLGAAPPAEILRARGLANEMLAAFDAAHQDLESAIESASASDDLEVEWRALQDLALLWAGRDYARMGEYVQRALELARQLDDRASVAHSLNRLGNWHMNVEHIAEALTCHHDALAIFEDLGDRPGIAETLDLLGLVSFEAAQPVEAVAYCDRAIPLLRELNDRQRLIGAMVLRTVVMGSYALDVPVPSTLTLDDRDAALRMAREIGWRAGESFASWELALWHGPRGEYGRALELAQNGLSIAEEIGHRQWMTGAHTALASVYFDLLDLQRARTHADQVLQLSQAIGSRIWVRIAAGLVALIAVAQRDLGGADAAFAHISGSDFGGDTIGHQMCRWADAQVWLMRRKPQIALEILDRFDGARTTSPRFLMVRGDVLTALGHHVEAADAFRRALIAADAVHARWLNWRIHASFGRLYTSRRDASAAERSFATARAEIHELALAIPDTALRDNFVQAALGTMPTRHPPSERRLTKEQFGGLTTREREVAALIAEGLSNRAVAERLVVGERTVETYVSSILNKLGYGSRAQIAAWAVDRGLAKPL